MFEKLIFSKDLKNDNKKFFDLLNTQQSYKKAKDYIVIAYSKKDL